MLLNKRKRNPGQNLKNNWVRVNNVCEPAPKSMFCPPPPQGIQRTPEVCFELANRQWLFNWAIIAHAQRPHGLTDQLNQRFNFICCAGYCGLASFSGHGDAIRLISNVTFAKQRRYPGSRSPMDSTSYRKCFSNFLPI